MYGSSGKRGLLLYFVYEREAGRKGSESLSENCEVYVLEFWCETEPSVQLDSCIFLLICLCAVFLAVVN